jgi:hypothetical protein
VVVGLDPDDLAQLLGTVTLSAPGHPDEITHPHSTAPIFAAARWA